MSVGRVGVQANSLELGDASRKLGSSFQNAHSTSAKIFRRRISAVCANVGALESGFTVEPCAARQHLRSIHVLSFARKLAGKPDFESAVCKRANGSRQFRRFQVFRSDQVGEIA